MIIIVLLVGLLMVAIALRIEHTNWKTVSRDLLRDTGIAFLIAAIVTIGYEQYARSLYDRENFVTLLQTIMGKVVPPSVWKEVQSTVIERDRIRRDINIRIRVARQESLPAHQAVMWMEYGYYLSGLQLQDRQIEVQHTLDDTIVDAAADLPRFEQIIIDQNVYDPYDTSAFASEGSKRKVSKDGKITIEERRATLKIHLGSEEKPPMRIVTVRRELINVPGEYDITMSELTEGRVSLAIDELPGDIEPRVEFITDRADKKTTPPLGNRWVFDGIMLPGQGIELQFRTRNH